MSLWDFLSSFIKPGLTEGGLIIIAILVTTSVLAIMVFPRVWSLVKQTAADTRIVKEQVKNSHSANFRDEQDSRHDEIATALSTLGAGQKALLKAVEGLQDDVRGHAQRITYVSERLDEHMDLAVQIIRDNDLI